MNEERIITADAVHEDVAIDRAIRPRSLKEYAGQPAA